MLNPTLVGNKLDLENQRAVSYEERKQYADEATLIFTEKSAKSTKNIINLFESIAKKLINKNQSNNRTNLLRLLDSTAKTEPKKCSDC